MSKRNSLKPYLPFLIGQLFKTPKGFLIIDEIGVNDKYKLWATYDERWNQDILNELGCSGRGFYMTEVKPILRRVDSITNKEREELNSIGTWHSGDFNVQRVREAQRTAWFLKKKFDVFGLIGMGLAEDMATVKKELREKWLKRK